MKRGVGIKAGSSVFQDDSSYAAVAQMLVPLAAHYEQIFFVVSAKKGETDRTIDEIAMGESAVTGLSYEGLRAELRYALRGDPPRYKGRFNRPSVAARLVQPEGDSVHRLTEELEALGIDALAVEHGSAYPIFAREPFGPEETNYLYAQANAMASELRGKPDYKANIVVIPGFAVRNNAGEILCTGRGSSDLTVAHFAKLFGLGEIIYWKDSGGWWRNPDGPEEGVYDRMTRKQVAERTGEQILDRRVFSEFDRGIVITSPGYVRGGTRIDPALMVYK